MNQQNSQNVDNERIYNVLCEIRDKIMLLVQANSRQLREARDSLFQKNDNLKKVYALINGKRTTQEIAEEVSLTVRAVQMLIRELEENCLIQIRKRGRAFLPQKI